MHLKKTQYAEMVKISRSGIVEKYKLYHTKMVSFSFCVKYWGIYNIFEIYTSSYVFNMYQIWILSKFYFSYYTRKSELFYGKCKLKLVRNIRILVSVV